MIRNSLFITIILLISIIALIYFRLIYLDEVAKRENLNKQVGEYILDLPKTDLGQYTTDRVRYGKLKLLINRDGTFKFNISVPFVFKINGKWKAAGYDIDEWNILYYENTNIKIPMTKCCLSDSTIYLNGMEPQDGERSVQELHFKKVHPGPYDFR